MAREIGWSHNLLILDRCKEPLEREYYLRAARKFGWSKNVLVHQIDNQTVSGGFKTVEIGRIENRGVKAGLRRT